MNIILNDSLTHNSLLPLSFTKPVSELRVGILTIREKWEKHLRGSCSWKTEDYLSVKYSTVTKSENLLLNASVCPNNELLEAIGGMRNGQSLVNDNCILAQKLDGGNGNFESGLEKVPFDGKYSYIDKPWKIFSLNGEELESDFLLLTEGRVSAELNSTNTILGDRIFAEEGVEAECAILNSTSGPIYLGKDSTVMEGSVVRGALALCEHASLKLSTKIYGPTTVGPYSKVGGEVNNSVITGYSNKGHDGFLGNSVIGEWCNLGADTNNSNLKNNYDQVKLWSYKKGGFERTGLQFCGLIMGDHSKCGINTMFNTGTVVGVASNIFGSGFPRNFVPSYSWGGASGFTTHNFEKAMVTAQIVMKRRGLDLTMEDREILKSVFEATDTYRTR